MKFLGVDLLGINETPVLMQSHMHLKAWPENQEDPDADNCMVISFSIN